MPFSSSPWIAAESQMRGPEDRPLITATGRASSDPVGTLAKGNSIRARRPGRTVTSPMVTGSLFRGSDTGGFLDVLDDRPGDVDSAGALDSFQAW